MNTIPQDLDWVSERAKCSPGTVFSALESQVKADVERRESLRNANEMQYGVGFSLRSGAYAFQVTVNRMSEVMGTAIFEKTAVGINVRYKNGSILAGVLTLGNDGRCRLRVADSEELEFWQFRKRSLEPLFFNILSELRGSE